MRAIPRRGEGRREGGWGIRAENNIPGSPSGTDRSLPLRALQHFVKAVLASDAGKEPTRWHGERAAAMSRRGCCGGLEGVIAVSGGRRLHF